MIEDGIITLADRKGASRQALWKCVSSKYPEVDFKQYLVRLKKLAHDGPIQYKKGRYTLEASYKAKKLNEIKRGGKPKKRVLKTKATKKKIKEESRN